MLVLGEEILIDLGGGRSKGRGSNELLVSVLVLRYRGGISTPGLGVARRDKRKSKTYQLRVANELAGEPEERLLEVVVGLGGDIVVLEVLLAVEGDGLGLDLALLHIDLVTAENDGDSLADTDEVT